MNVNFNKKLFLVIFLILVIVFGGVYYQRSKEKTSSQEVGEKVINYLNKNIPGIKVSFTDIVEDEGLYKINLEIGGEKFVSYVTKDGKLFFPNFINLEEDLPKEPSQEVSKSQTPDVKLFVMSYCPFGLQAEKMFLPVYDLLKNKTKMGIYFVDYIMHEKKEIDENLRQYCIQKEEKEKYYHYLGCFVKDGNFEKCLSEAQIDKEKMDSCISQTDQEYEITKLYNDRSSWLNGQFPKFNVHSDLNEKYGIRGSPTIVINDKVVEISPRSPEKFKEAICQSFNSPPPECSQKLSDEAFSPGFGLGTGVGGGQCE